MQVAFYQLLKTPLEKALPKLIEKVYASGMRALVVCESQERLEVLNSVLWTYSPGAFLPHGAQGDPKRHPIWLTLSPENVNSAEVVVVTNGALLAGDKFKKCLDIFDGHNEAVTTAARQRYKAYKDQGLSVDFWKQGEDGSWEKQGS